MLLRILVEVRDVAGVLPLRRQGPSGKLSGPTRKPLRGLGVSVSFFSLSTGRLGAMVVVFM